jgi:hypothetical protein
MSCFVTTHAEGDEVSHRNARLKNQRKNSANSFRMRRKLVIIILAIQTSRVYLPLEK